MVSAIQLVLSILSSFVLRFSITFSKSQLSTWDWASIYPRWGFLTACSRFSPRKPLFLACASAICLGEAALATHHYLTRFVFVFVFVFVLPPTIISPGSNLHFHFLFHFHFPLASHHYFTRFLLPLELTCSILVAGDSYVHVFPGASQIPRVSTVGFQCWRSPWFSLRGSSASCPSSSSSLRSPSKPI